MLKLLGRRKEKKRKERKKGKKHTNSIARIQARASRPAVTFACLTLHHAAKTRSISEYYNCLTVYCLLIITNFTESNIHYP